METRKNPRLREWDYSTNAAYFVTVCSDNKRHIFGHISVGRDDPGAPYTELTAVGAVAEKYILSIDEAYENVCVDKYVIMPNHIHILLTVDDKGAPGSSRPTISQIISAFKRFTNKEAGQKLWQTSFYDHIIRDERDYLTHWQYIDDNPAKWAEDEYF